MSVRRIWEAESEEELGHIHLLAGNRGILASSGSKALYLDEAGLKRWTVSLKGRVVGLGFSPREETFFVAYENGMRLVNRIGVTIKEVPLASSPLDFTVSEIAAENNSTTLFPIPIDLLGPLLRPKSASSPDEVGDEEMIEEEMIDDELPELPLPEGIPGRLASGEHVGAEKKKSD